ncbi:hypothetical protein H310_00673 [Aphanomyces invadans]|uniref:Uncharacterized protein n=1 Tax=Aphanomyces invadans TaxID=157072 RepID=A0A024UWK9_9STRA|nr:hypothetical protein H310_00673 [Aphanomyces invadans]ETW10350.1 hypothetical protein H310_00673 [Aphanomyces invadans]|eukprot:XP_008861761.1 hypothetical protein H310_00673 [Aphanomyces invadans]
MLTEKNKEDRMKFALSFLSPWSQGNHVFKNMYDFVHVDEKWFFMTKRSTRITSRRLCSLRLLQDLATITSQGVIST